MEVLLTYFSAVYVTCPLFANSSGTALITALSSPARNEIIVARS